MTEGPLVSLCMIIKDEAGNLPRCLASCRELIDEAVIVDTGSQDGSKEIARNLGAKVFEFTWCNDFSAARNYSLVQARGDWVLVLDADEELSAGASGIIRPKLDNQAIEGFLLTMVNYQGECANEDYETYLYPKIFRHRPEYRFTRPLHEQLSGLPEDLSGLMPLPGVKVFHYGYLRNVQTAKAKVRRNLQIIEAEIGKNPDCFNNFNLAMEYARANMPEKALQAAENARKMLNPNALYGAKLFKLLATVQLQLKRYSAALAVSREGSSYFPDFPDLLYLQGLAETGLGNYAQAIGCLRQCQAMAPQASLLHLRDAAYTGYRCDLLLGDAYTALGRMKDAIDCYTKAFLQNRTCYTAVHNLAALCANDEAEWGKVLTRFALHGKEIGIVAGYLAENGQPRAAAHCVSLYGKGE